MKEKLLRKIKEKKGFPAPQIRVDNKLTTIFRINTKNYDAE